MDNLCEVTMMEVSTSSDAAPAIRMIGCLKILIHEHLSKYIPLFWSCVRLLMCVSANARDIPGKNLFKPRNSEKYSPLDIIVTSTISGTKRIEKSLFFCFLLVNEIRSI
jgi:hypothetical protein